MTIPKLHYISQGASPKEHISNIQKACTSGAELVVLNLKDITEKKLLKLAKEAKEITAHFQTRLIINQHYKIAKEIKADGVHFDSIADCPTTVRKDLYTWQSVSVTANTLEECENLTEKRVDYILLSPFKTITESSITPLGLNGYTAIKDVLQAEILLIGFGNITTEDVTSILATGISGIAVSDAITQNFDSIKTFNQLLNASSTQEQRHSFYKN